MACVEKVNREKRHAWRVCYRDPNHRQRYKTYPRKADADLFAATVEADTLRGDRTDSQLGRTPFSGWWDLGRVPETVGDSRKKEDSASGIH